MDDGNYQKRKKIQEEEIKKAPIIRDRGQKGSIMKTGYLYYALSINFDNLYACELRKHIRLRHNRKDIRLENSQ